MVKRVALERMGTVTVCGYVVSNDIVAGGVVNSDAVNVLCDVVSDQVAVCRVQEMDAVDEALYLHVGDCNVGSERYVYSNRCFGSYPCRFYAITRPVDEDVILLNSYVANEATDKSVGFADPLNRCC